MKCMMAKMKWLVVGCVVLAGGCAEPVEVPVSTNGEPFSKPVKMPPKVKILGKVSGMELDEFFALQESGGALVYDVRNAYFYGIDRIPGALNWPHSDYEAQVQQRDLEIQRAFKEGKKVVLYCFNASCPEARNVARKLARRDYEVHTFSAGIDEWREAGLPLESGGVSP
jgi:rhodanese-related sulfurtransferase